MTAVEPSFSTFIAPISFDLGADRAILFLPGCRAECPRGLVLTVGSARYGNREHRSDCSDQRTIDLKQQSKANKARKAPEVSKVRKASKSAKRFLPFVQRAPCRSTMAVIMPTAYLDTSGAAAYLGLSRNTLEKWRCADLGPPYIRLGRKKVRYLPADLDSWREGRRHTPRDLGEGQEAQP